MKSTEQTHGRYLIRAFEIGGKVSARAYLGSERITYAEGTSTEDVLRELRSSLDDRDAQQQNARKNGVPTAQEFENAFVRLNDSIGHNHWLMLKALLSAPNKTLTTKKIAVLLVIPASPLSICNLGESPA